MRIRSLKRKLAYKKRVLLAQQLYNMMIKYDTWSISIEKDPPEGTWFDPHSMPEMKVSNTLRINLEIDTGGESGPTPYVRGEP